MTYLEAIRDLYREAAGAPMSKLCCTTQPVWRLPGLAIPKEMLEMNYGCGTTVHPRDLGTGDRVLYVGVGGGMEALQFSYFGRSAGCVIAVDAVDEMIDRAARNLAIAQEQNDWFDVSFVDLRKGDALALPLEDGSVGVAAQNCLFNMFSREHLDQALREMHRVLRPHGSLFMSDPIASRPIPPRLAQDHRLRAECISGALPLEQYLGAIVEAGFGTIEVRKRVPYRVLDERRYDLPEHLLLESIEVCAIKDPIPEDGPCVFTGRTAIYFGDREALDDGRGHRLTKDIPLSVCDKTARALAALGRDDILLTDSTWHYQGGGCC